MQSTSHLGIMGSKPDSHANEVVILEKLFPPLCFNF